MGKIDLEGFTFHAQDSPIQIHGVLSVECGVSVISLRPGEGELNDKRIIPHISRLTVALLGRVNGRSTALGLCKPELHAKLSCQECFLANKYLSESEII